MRILGTAVNKLMGERRRVLDITVFADLQMVTVAEGRVVLAVVLNRGTGVLTV